MRYTVYSNARYACILLLSILLASCSGSSGFSRDGTPNPDNRPAWEEKFPTRTYVTAWGLSTRNHLMAEQNARAAVAAAVSSSIESELTSVMKSTNNQGDVRDYQRLESITKTRTHFKHAELIHPVPGTAHKTDGEYWVMAVLSRRDAVDELMVPYEKNSTPYRVLAANLESSKNDPPEFTRGWKSLKKHHLEMQPAAAEIRAVAGGNLPELVRDESLWKDTEELRQGVLKKFKVILVLEDNPELDHEVLAEKFGSALANLGLPVDGQVCRPGLIKLSIKPQLKWTRVVGRVVQLEFEGEVGMCDRELPWNVFQIQDRRMRGEGRRPLENLYERMDVRVLENQLREIFAPYLPF